MDGKRNVRSPEKLEEGGKENRRLLRKHKSLRELQSVLNSHQEKHRTNEISQEV